MHVCRCVTQVCWAEVSSEAVWRGADYLPSGGQVFECSILSRDFRIEKCDARVQGWFRVRAITQMGHAFWSNILIFSRRPATSIHTSDLTSKGLSVQILQLSRTLPFNLNCIHHLHSPQVHLVTPRSSRSPTVCLQVNDGFMVQHTHDISASITFLAHMHRDIETSIRSRALRFSRVVVVGDGHAFV